MVFQASCDIAHESLRTGVVRSHDKVPNMSLACAGCSSVSDVVASARTVICFTCEMQRLVQSCQVIASFEVAAGQYVVLVHVHTWR